MALHANKILGVFSRRNIELNIDQPGRRASNNNNNNNSNNNNNNNNEEEEELSFALRSILSSFVTFLKTFSRMIEWQLSLFSRYCLQKVKQQLTFPVTITI